MSEVVAAVRATGEERISREALLPAETYRPPLTSGHERLAAIWGEALNVDRIGIDDDYFALGGDSLAAAVICAEVLRVTGQKVTPSALVDASTVASFAVVIEGDLRQIADRMLVPVRTTGERPPLVLVHGFDGQMLFAKRLAWLMPADQPIYGVQARGLDGKSAPHATVDEMARDYAAAILEEIGTREIFLGGYCMGGVVAIEVLRHLLQGGGKARRLILIDPPPRPVRKAREMSRMTRDAFVAERSEVLIRRFADFTGNRPDLASHYGPSGEGLTHALQVARGLALAYGSFVPSWTRFPSTILWSVDRAEKHGGQPHEYRLTRGPTVAYVVRNKRRPVTHRVLLRDGIQPIATLLKKTMGVEDAADQALQSIDG